MDKQFGEPRYVYDVVDSTLDIARLLADSGAGHGTLVTAVHQSKGRGRRQAKWLDAPGDSALLTFILHPSPRLVDEPWQMAFIVSLAVVKAARDLGLENAMVKWPNDIYSDGAKIAGLIVELVTKNNLVSCFLVGIGINVLQAEFPNAADFVQPPTSFAIQMTANNYGMNIPTVQQVTDTVTAHLGKALDEYDGKTQLIDSWRKYQVTGHVQNGISLDGTRSARGEYLDVRHLDGAGLIRDEISNEVVAILPSL